MDKSKIIAVDDQPENLQLIIETLKHDYAVVVTTSAKKALSLALRTPKAAAILLDVSMPEMNGFDVLSQLKSNVETQDIPVIFVTGHNDENDFEKGIALGASDFVIKPISPTLLKQRLKNCLSITNE